ncbi:MAG: ABC transporter permease [Wenzhouxiangella sp.]|nr:ABC transporter permease [Wenzhouxiangella sp.]MCH8477838.1 ABC transporter permease [Wenzhouxiangella sp.]TVR98987.1 MAG: ABC transporter permease [Wenzhouxiangellaceae bacterium]
MNTMTEILPRSGFQASSRRLARALAFETLAEWRNLVRMPAFSVPTLLFPVGFYTMFAVVLPFANTPEAAATLLVNFTIFGVFGPGLFAFGVGLASDRDQGWLRLKQACPLPVPVMMLARTLGAMIFALVVVVALFAVAATLGGVRLERGAWALLALVGVLAVIPASALGLAFGAWLNARAAMAIVNIAYLGSAVLSGLWFPLQMMPSAIQSIAPAMPPYHLAELGRQAAGIEAASPACPVFWLLCVTILAVALAMPGLRRPEGKS